MAVSAVKKETARNQEAEDAGAAAHSSPQKSRALLKIVIALFVVAGLGGGAYWYLNQNKSDNPASAKPQPAKPPVFVPLEPFTVNLQLEDSPQFLQIGLSFKMADNAAVDALKVYMPEVRDRILLLLSGRKSSELLTGDGKRKLSSDIVAIVNAILAPEPAKAAAPIKKASTEATPPAEGESAAPAEGEEKPVGEAATPATASPPSPPVLAVLFTSFIVQ